MRATNLRLVTLTTIALALALALTPNASALQFQSEELDPGAFYDQTFAHATTVSYHDHKNPSAEGTITIVADTDERTDQHTIQILDSGGEVRFEPAERTIEAGDTVRWSNAGQDIHMVMGWTEGDEMDMDGMDHEGHGDHDHDHSDTESAPGPGALALPALGLLALARRHHHAPRPTRQPPQVGSQG